MLKPSARLATRFAAAIALLVLPIVSATQRLGAQSGAVTITALGAPTVQDFDGLVASGSATWTNDSTIPGWYHARTGSGAAIVANNGGSNAGNLYSYGTGAGSDRALGSVGSAGAAVGSLYWGARLANGTPSTITSLTVSYTGEQWRNGGGTTPTAQTMEFSYRTGSGLGNALTDFTTGGTAVPELHFTSPIVSTTGAALDGNAAPNGVALSHTITGLNLAPGEEMLLRWTDIDHSGNDHGLAIDDLQIIATGSSVPPPVPADVLISQVYGGGGNSGATLTHDFVELFNSGTTAVNVTGWSIQYATSSGSTWQATPLTGSIPAGGYYLVQLAAGSGGTAPLPAPDATGTIALSATAGKIALRSASAALAGPCPSGLIDLVGYGGANCFEGSGPVSAMTNTTAASRKRSGCFDSDNNHIDFSTGTPVPRNSASPNGSCTPVSAAIHEIQGAGLVSPLAGRYVSTTGVVTARKNNGFFVQTPDDAADSDAMTSQGLFVFTSTAPPVAVGDAVSVGGTATEFFNLTQIEASLPGDVQVTATSRPIPAAVVLTTTTLDPAGTPQQLERFEGMRMHASSLTSVAPTNEFGETATVLTGVARPMREPGISILEPVPPDPTTGAPDCCIPRFDENPERLVVDSDGLAGAVPIAVTSHVLLTGVTGPLDFSFGSYKLLPESAPAVTANMSGLAVPAPAADEFSVGGFNIENFAGETQRRKAALAIRQLMRSPDVIGHIEIPDLASLQALAAQVNADAVAAGEADPGYEAVLIPAPQGGTQHVGFLVKTSRVRIDAVSQERAGDTFTNPNNGQQETLHDRPPLALRATVDPSGVPQPVIVIVSHLRSFIDIELVGGEGVRVRAKRTVQAESLAGLLQELQVGNPGTPIVSIGDYNAYEFNDGYTDPISVITGAPTPDDQIVVDQSPDLVEPNFVNLTDTLPLEERYSFLFQGTPQALDHVLVNQAGNALVRRYAIARGNSDFPEVPAALFAGDPARPERASDHDMPVAYFRLPPPSADLSISMAAAPETTAAGQNVTFTITATNAGPSPAQSVVVTNHLSPLASVVSCQATGGGVCNTAGADTTVSFASLAPGASEVITLVAALSCAVPNNAVVVNMATIDSATGDPNGANDAASASTTAANAAPSIAGATATPSRLLLPLHQMVPVTVNYGASDTCGAVTTTLTVQSDEPVTGAVATQGLAALTTPDWQVVDSHRVRLRAEHSVRGDGRVYTITIRATDAAGGVSSQQVTVTVPRRP